MAVEISGRDYSLIGRDTKLAEERRLASAESYASPIPRPRLRELMTEEEKTYIPDTERRKVYWFVRSYVLIYASAIGWACSIGSMADGFVMDRLIERPKHNGHFDFTTGQAKRAPACRPLKTYPVKVEAGRVLIYLHSSEQESQR